MHRLDEEDCTISAREASSDDLELAEPRSLEARDQPTEREQRILGGDTRDECRSRKLEFGAQLVGGLPQPGFGESMCDLALGL